MSDDKTKDPASAGEATESGDHGHDHGDDHGQDHVHGPGCSHDHSHFGHGEPSAPFQRGAPKVGRNDPCSCGSGKKFKKCCLKSRQG